MKYLATLLLLISSSFLSAQWTKQSFPTTENLWKVRFVNENTGWVAGHKNIYKTTNGGTIWTKQDTSMDFCDAMFVLNEQIVMFSNWTGTGDMGGGIRRTTDGGTNWTTANAEKNYYTDIDFGSATVGYASSGGIAGNKPLVNKTTDAGATWTTISQNFPKAKYELTGISFVNENIGWAVSYDGFVFKTTNGGIDWSLPDSLGSESFRDIEFFNKDSGWAFGGIAGEKVIARTTNGGASWTKTKNGGGSLREAKAITSKNIYCAGWNDEIIYTTNAGEMWNNQKSNISGFESIDMVDERVGYSVASLGTLYKTINGGILSVDLKPLNTAPRVFALEQNYPNPFNPITTIQFSIPVKNFVSLKLFSITGELADELLRNIMDQGTYSIQWNAGLRPSGVYFYTITTGSFSETKKLMLIK